MNLPSRALALLLPLALVTGCLGGDGDAGPAISVEQQKADDILGGDRDKLVDAAALIPKNYSMALQKLLPTVEKVFEGTVDTSAVGSYEGERDESGIDYRSVVDTYDVSDLVPVGQPVELVIDLFWDANEANSADLDIFVDVPGTRTTFSDVSETMNWNIVVKTIVVNTVGVQGQPALVGAQISSGMVSQGFAYRVEVRATYVQDVLTPYHPWALEVPAGAGGLIFESVKAGGDEHINASFVLIGPDDDLVKFVVFDDINIPSESILIPVPKPGQYVFYALSMHGGFLSAKSDVPLEASQAVPLGLVVTETVDTNAPAPGVAGKDPLAGSAGGGVVPTEDQGAVVIDLAFNDKFPLRVTGFIRGQITGAAKLTLSSPLGEVHKLTKMATYEDESGSIGYTSDHEGGVNNVVTWTNLQKGAWTMSVVNDNANVEIGHTLVTYER